MVEGVVMAKMTVTDRDVGICGCGRMCKYVPGLGYACDFFSEDEMQQRDEIRNIGVRMVSKVRRDTEDRMLAMLLERFEYLGHA